MKKISTYIIALLVFALLPPAAVQAAEKENVTLNTADGSAEIQLEIPEASVGISTLKLSVNISGDTDKLDQTQPLSFEAGEDTVYTLLETRYNAAESRFTIYLSHTGSLTDKTFFVLGKLTPNVTVDEAYRIGILIPENGLEYIDGSGVLNEDAVIPASSAEISGNQPEETPDGTPEETPDGTPEETPDGIPEETPETTPGDTESDLSNGTGESETGNGNHVTQDGQSNSGQGVDNAGKTEQKAVKTGDSDIVLPFVLSAGAGILGLTAVSGLRIFRKRK